MTEPINPALSVDQWADVSSGNTVHLGEMGHPDVYVESRDGLTISGGYAGDSVDVPDGRCRHALAAIALYGQKFGFTREMVNALRVVVRGWGGCDDKSGTGENEYVGEELYPLLEAAIENLEALLPPEKT